MTASTPTAEPLTLPVGYGATTTTLDWDVVRARLKSATQYWLTLSRSRGRSPYATPVDGLWVDDMFFYGGSPETTHRKLATRNPLAAIHLPDAWQVVVVEGTIREFRPGPDLVERLASAQRAKYADYPPPDHTEVSALVPERARAWMNFPQDCTRFTFPQSGS